MLELLGPRLPDKYNPSKYELYCKMILLLFKPFRNVTEILQGKDQYSKAFEIWEKSQSALQFMEFNQDYYTGKEQFDDSELESVKRLFNAEDDIEEFDSDTESSDSAISEIPEDNEIDDDVEMVHEELSKFSTTAINCLHNFDKLLLPHLNAESMKEALLLIGEQQQTFVPIETDLLLRINEFLSSIEQHPLVWQDPIHLNVPLQPSCCSPRNLSQHFKLQFKQHVCFIYYANQLLAEWSSSNPRQLIGFLQGPAGYGKSQVIQAILSFKNNWNMEHTVKVVSFQGSAAVALGNDGQTMHKCMLWKDVSNNIPNYTFDQKLEWASVSLMIIDEISMLAQRLLGKLDACLKVLKGCNEPFGGVNILFAGDWLQLSPIGTPCYHIPTKSSKLFDSEGYEAYMKINFVVTLDINMRQQNYQQWAMMLDRFRFGTATMDDINLLNEKCMPATKTIPVTADICPVITGSNEFRKHYNQKAVYDFALLNNQVIHRVYAKISKKKQNALEELRSLGDDRTGRLPMVLDLVIGMPVMLTKNHQNPKTKIANGTLGHIVGIQLSSSSTFKTIEKSGVVIHEYQIPPEIVFVKIRKCDITLIPNLPIGVIPILIHQSSSSFKVELNYRSIHIQPIQFPIVPAFAITTEKCQGITLDAMIAAPFRSEARLKPQTNSLYVVLSRITDFTNLRLMEPLTSSDLQYFKPSKNVMNEINRLAAIVTMYIT